MALGDDGLILLLAGALILLVSILLLTVRHYRDRVQDLEFKLKSREVTYGRINEQFAPFMASYPFEAKNFRFLGSPVDGVQFEEDRIVFVEFKANTSSLNTRQRRVRDLVEAGRVEWLVFETKPDAAAAPPAD